MQVDHEVSAQAKQLLARAASRLSGAPVAAASANGDGGARARSRRDRRRRVLRDRDGRPGCSTDGVDDFVVLERADDVGGTWRDNTYPGCAVRHPLARSTRSRSRPTRTGAAPTPLQPEIREYLRRCRRRARRGTPHPLRLRRAAVRRWDDDAAPLASRDLRTGEMTADVLIGAMGGLTEPEAARRRPGSRRFEGTLFHSAQWDHDHDLVRRAGRCDRHRRVGGADRARDRSASVGALHLFQRTPAWVMPDGATARVTELRAPRCSARVPAAQLRRAWARICSRCRSSTCAGDDRSTGELSTRCNRAGWPACASAQAGRRTRSSARS